jgi:hypothetical protein
METTDNVIAINAVANVVLTVMAFSPGFAERLF